MLLCVYPEAAAHHHSSWNRFPRGAEARLNVGGIGRRNVMTQIRNPLDVVAHTEIQRQTRLERPVVLEESESRKARRIGRRRSLRGRQSLIERERLRVRSGIAGEV